MTAIILNCISNWMDSDKHALSFEEAVNAYSALVERHLRNFKLVGEVKCIYVQFQYNCAGLPGAKKGLKVSYSPRSREIQAYAEVSKGEFDNLKKADRRMLISSRLGAILSKCVDKVPKVVAGNLDELVEKMMELNAITASTSPDRGSSSPKRKTSGLKCR